MACSSQKGYRDSSGGGRNGDETGTKTGTDAVAGVCGTSRNSVKKRSPHGVDRNTMSLRRAEQSNSQVGS